jgi:hypothetical protein
MGYNRRRGKKIAEISKNLKIVHTGSTILSLKPNQKILRYLINLFRDSVILADLKDLSFSCNSFSEET